MNSSIDSVAGTSLVRFPTGTLLALHRALAQNRSPRESAMLIRELGFESGEAFYQSFAEWLNERDAGKRPEALPADLFWRQLAEFFSFLGWGSLHVETLHDGIASLTTETWVEADTTAHARQPMCHFTTGILADLLGRIAGTDLAVMEVECRSTDDQHCRFLLGSPDALELLYERLRAGASLSDALNSLG